MSLSRWYPVMRAFSSPRSAIRPLASPFWHHLDDFSRLDSQVQQMNREMDRMFNDFHRYGPGFFGTGYSRYPGQVIESAAVMEKDGKKHLQMQFDVSAFKPEEIEIKSKDDGKILEIHAKQEESSDDGMIKREYHREFALPENVDVKEFSSELDPEGILSVTAPLKEVKEKPKIEKRTENITMEIKHE